jgi:hypothetical protein
MHQIGKAAGARPREVAIHMVAELPVAYRMSFNPLVVRKWLQKGKIDPQTSQMRRAFSRLDIFDSEAA